MTEEFQITVGSDPDEEELVADIYYSDQIVAEVTSPDNMSSFVVRLHALTEQPKSWLSLAGLEAAIEQAKKRLQELRRE
ncbi:MAG: hypothetical protein P8Z76_05625 [Alphaproteobacteria bacterium]|jgi:hypothetical protein